jgi:hypothetical protein
VYFWSGKLHPIHTFLLLRLSLAVWGLPDVEWWLDNGSFLLPVLTDHQTKEELNLLKWKPDEEDEDTGENVFPAETNSCRLNPRQEIGESHGVSNYCKSQRLLGLKIPGCVLQSVSTHV